MEFRILGPLEVVDDGRQISLGGAKQRALLAILVLRANELVSTDRLIDALWGERPPDTAATALQVHVSQLRKLLWPGRILTRSTGYELRAGPEELDALQFEELLSKGRPGEALALWRGPVLTDVQDEPFAQSEIARLAELRAAALERRVADDLARGRHREVIGELEALVREHPMREHIRAQLMLALYRSGRQAEALARYQETRTLLVEELGIEPGHELQELERKILNQDPSLVPAETRPEPVTVAKAEPDTHRQRYLFLDQFFASKAGGSR